MEIEKIATYFGLGVSGLLGLVFLLDLALGIPFKGASMVIDICVVLVAAILGFLSWRTMKEAS